MVSVSMAIVDTHYIEAPYTPINVQGPKFAHFWKSFFEKNWL